MEYTLGKITTDYHSTEDRVRILGEAQSGIVCEIWLSNRLLNRLISTLLDQSNQDIFKSEAVETFQQEAAVANFKSQPPVQHHQETVSWLATSINVARGDGARKLIFKDKASLSATIIFTDIQLRQWMEIVYKSYVKSEWSLAAWPAWFLTMHSQAKNQKGNDAIH